MISAARPGRFLRRLPILILALALAFVALPSLMHIPAQAQEKGGWSLRDLLFPRRSERVEPPVDVFRPPAPKARAKPRDTGSGLPSEIAPVAVDKAPDARAVLVVGDFMAAGLAEGLDAVFAQNPSVRVIDRSNGSSGLVRDDFYNWPQEIKSILAAENPAAVLVMIGSNDRQQMPVADTREQPRSDAWDKEYERRAGALAKDLADSKVPFLWVGMPAFKPSKMTSDMLAFNDVYRAAAEASKGEFVDIWDGFVDENGAFITSGPDVNGQPVRLRSDDGINLSRAGKRKVAFYAEKPLLKILGLSDPSGASDAHTPAGVPAEQPGQPVQPATVDRTAPMMLNDPSLDGGTELLGAGQAGTSNHEVSAQKLMDQELAPAAPPGRADDFSWPPRAEAPGTPDTGDTTAATSR